MMMQRQEAEAPEDPAALQDLAALAAKPVLAEQRDPVAPRVPRVPRAKTAAARVLLAPMAAAAMHR
jgi:hypothetical protein